MTMTPEDKTILAASAPWLGALLNVVPGLGTGYIYQRRWRAYWITTALATGWFLLGAVLGSGASATELTAPDPRNQLVGLGGLLLLAAVTAAEAFREARRARKE
jgi:peptidoglycan/LPS O-acetylase OafA/YrhL